MKCILIVDGSPVELTDPELSVKDGILFVDWKYTATTDVEVDFAGTDILGIYKLVSPNLTPSHERSVKRAGRTQLKAGNSVWIQRWIYGPFISIGETQLHLRPVTIMGYWSHTIGDLTLTFSEPSTFYPKIPKDRL